MFKKENYFLKEDLLDEYLPSELILVKENGKYRFAVHYYPGTPAIKILHNDKDILNTEVEFSDFVLTDPDRKSIRSRSRTESFKSHFVVDFAYCSPDINKNSKSDMNNLTNYIAPICKKMMSHQTAIEHKSLRMSLDDILQYEKHLNSLLRNKDDRNK